MKINRMFLNTISLALIWALLTPGSAGLTHNRGFGYLSAPVKINDRLFRELCGKVLSSAAAQSPADSRHVLRAHLPPANKIFLISGADALLPLRGKLRLESGGIEIQNRGEWPAKEIGDFVNELAAILFRSEKTAEYRESFRTCLREALSNSFAHAAQGHIWIAWVMTDDAIVFEIVDEGKEPFSLETRTSGRIKRGEKDRISMGKGAGFKHIKKLTDEAKVYPLKDKSRQIIGNKLVMIKYLSPEKSRINTDNLFKKIYSWFFLNIIFGPFLIKNFLKRGRPESLGKLLLSLDLCVGWREENVSRKRFVRLNEFFIREIQKAEHNNLLSVKDAGNSLAAEAKLAKGDIVIIDGIVALLDTVSLYEGRKQFTAYYLANGRRIDVDLVSEKISVRLLVPKKPPAAQPLNRLFQKRPAAVVAVFVAVYFLLASGVYLWFSTPDVISWKNFVRQMFAAALAGGAGNYLAQMYEVNFLGENGSVNWERVCRAAVLGIVLFAPVWGVGWFGTLLPFLAPKIALFLGVPELLARWLLDQFLWGPFFALWVSFFSGRWFVEGYSAKTSLRDTFIDSNAQGWKKYLKNPRMYFLSNFPFWAPVVMLVFGVLHVLGLPPEYAFFALQPFVIIWFALLAHLYHENEVVNLWNIYGRAGKKVFGAFAGVWNKNPAQKKTKGEELVKENLTEYIRQWLDTLDAVSIQQLLWGQKDMPPMEFSGEVDNTKREILKNMPADQKNEPGINASVSGIDKVFSFRKRIKHNFPQTGAALDKKKIDEDAYLDYVIGIIGRFGGQDEAGGIMRYLTALKKTDLPAQTKDELLSSFVDELLRQAAEDLARKTPAPDECLALFEVDYHAHTDYSLCADQTVLQLLYEAYTQGMKKIAVSDHQCLHGAYEALQLASAFNLKIMPAVEIATGRRFQDRSPVEEFRDILLYFPDIEQFYNLYEKYRNGQEEIMSILQRANELVNTNKKATLSPREAAALAHEYKGIAVLAHIGRFYKELFEKEGISEHARQAAFNELFSSDGHNLDGLEVIHWSIPPGKSEKLLERVRAAEMKLGKKILLVIGSDAHHEGELGMRFGKNGGESAAKQVLLQNQIFSREGFAVLYENIFPALSGQEFTIKQICNIAGHKYLIRKIFSGGQLRQPDYVQAFAGDYGAMNDFMELRETEAAVSVIDRITTGQIELPLVFKRNEGAFGYYTFFLDRDSQNNVVLTAANSTLFRDEVEPLLKKAEGVTITRDREKDIVRVVIDAIKNHSVKNVLQIAYEKMIATNGDPGMVERVMPVFRCNGFAYETRHTFIGNLLTGVCRFPQKGAKGVETWFARVGSSAEFSNVTYRFGASIISWPDIYHPLYSVFNVADKQGFENYVEHLVREQFRYLVGRLRAAGIFAAIEVRGEFDLMWLKNENGDWPIPVLIESDLEALAPGLLNQKVLVGGWNSVSRVESDVGLPLDVKKIFMTVVIEQAI